MSGAIAAGLALLAQGPPGDCGGLEHSIMSCHGDLLPTVLVATVAVAVTSTVAGVTVALLLPQIMNAISGVNQALAASGSTGPADAAASLSPGGELYSRSLGPQTNQEVLDQNIGLPRTQETVDLYTQLAEVDFRGASFMIVADPSTVAYLDYMGAVARTDVYGVQLGPAAFQDEENLVRTLGHESIHVQQWENEQVTTLTEPLEDEAYAAENGFVEAWRRNTQ